MQSVTDMVFLVLGLSQVVWLVVCAWSAYKNREGILGIGQPTNTFNVNTTNINSTNTQINNGDHR